MRVEERRAAAIACLVSLALAAAGCALGQKGSDGSLPGVAAAPPPIALTETSERYLKNVYQFECAPGYVPFAHGDGPAVRTRTDAEREAREAKLQTCLRERVAGVYTRPEVVEMMTWNGREDSLDDRERQAVIRFGDEFLSEYVKQLLERENQLENQAGQTAVQ